MNSTTPGDDAKTEDRDGKAGNVRRPTITLPANPNGRPLSAAVDLSYRRLAKLRAAPMGSLPGVRGPIRKSEREP